MAYRGNICSGLPNIHLQIIRITFECLSLPLFRTFPGQCLLIQCLIDLCTCSYGPMNVPSLIFLIPQFLLRTRTRMQSEGLVGVSSTTGLAMFPLATENGRSQRRKWPKRKPWNQVRRYMYTLQCTYSCVQFYVSVCKCTIMCAHACVHARVCDLLICLSVLCVPVATVELRGISNLWINVWV